MTEAVDYFTDMLEPGEELLSTLAGPTSTDRSWLQLAVTPRRVLAVKLTRAEAGAYRPVLRKAAERTSVRVRKLPGRLELYGLGEPLALVDIDAPAVFPQVEPFLHSWGGMLEREVEAAAPVPVPAPRSVLPLVAAFLLFAGGLVCAGAAALFLRTLLVG